MTIGLYTATIETLVASTEVDKGKLQSGWLLVSAC